MYDRDEPPLPIGAARVTPRQFAILMALIRVHARDRRCTIRTVGAEAGAGVASTWVAIQQLRRLGLADHWPAHAGTLRPVVRVVAVYR